MARHEAICPDGAKRPFMAMRVSHIGVDCFDLSEVSQGQPKQMSSRANAVSVATCDNHRACCTLDRLPFQPSADCCIPSGIRKGFILLGWLIHTVRYFCFKIIQATSTRSPTANSRVAIIPITPAMGGATRPAINTDALMARLYQARCEKRSFTGTFSRM